MSYQLNQNQKAHIQNLKDSGDYHLAYRYISEQIDDAVRIGEVSRQTQRWFEWAEQINGNYPSAINSYARVYSKLGAAFDGNTLTNEKFQDASNRIAEDVLQNVIDTSNIPTTPENIILTDITRGSEFMGTDLQDFPGTLVAGFLYDTPTIQRLILGSGLIKSTI